MSKYILYSSILFMFSGCFPAKELIPFRVSENYAKRRIVPNEIVLIINTKNIKIQNKSDIFDDIPADNITDPAILYQEYFKAAFENKIKSNFSNTPFKIVDYDNIATMTSKFTIPTTDSRNVYTMNTIKDGEQIKSISESSTIIVIDEINTHYTYGPSSTATIYLAGDFKYFIWDNKMGKLISYGLPFIESNFVFGTSEKDWKFVTEGAVKQILTNPPF